MQALVTVVVHPGRVGLAFLQVCVDQRTLTFQCSAQVLCCTILDRLYILPFPQDYGFEIGPHLLPTFLANLSNPNAIAVVADAIDQVH